MRVKDELNLNGSRRDYAGIAATVIGALIPIAVLLPVIMVSSGIVLFPDEVGYWADAMTMAGHDWSTVAELFPWYSYGYSILLTPLISVIDDPTVIYRAGLILNLIMIEATYLMWIGLSRRFCPDLKRYVSALISASAVCLPTYLTYVGINLPEICLVFCFTALLYVLCSYIDKPSVFKGILLSSLTIWLYAIHNRTVGIVLAMVICMVLLLISGRLKPSDIAVYIGTAAVLTAAFILGKDALTDRLWPNGIMAANEAGDQVDKIKTALTFKGAGKLMLLIFSQFGSISVSTLGLMPLGLAFTTTKAIGSIKSRKIADAIQYLFITMSFVFTLGISSLFVIEPNRIDQLVYTRYIDTVTGILCICGFLWIMRINSRRDAIVSCVVTGASVVVGMLCASVLADHFDKLENYNYVNAPGLSRLYLVNGSDFKSYISLMLIFVLLLPAAGYLGRNKKALTASVSAAVVAVILIYMAYPTVDWVKDRQEVYKASNGYLEEIRDSGKDVYCDADTDVEFLEYAAYRLYDVKIRNVYEEDNRQINEDYVILESAIEE